MDKANAIIKVMAAGTVCLSFILSFALAYVGKVDANLVVGAALAAFTGLIGGAGAIYLNNNGIKQGVNTAMSYMAASARTEKNA